MLNLKLKNITEALHAQLKESAECNRRSLNSEILTRLEIQFNAPAIDREKLASELKGLIERLPRVDHRIDDRGNAALLPKKNNVWELAIA